MFIFILSLLVLPAFGQYGPQHHHHNKDPLEVVLDWKLLEYDFPSASERQKAINAGNLIPENAIPIDVDIVYDATRNSNDRIFVTIPRFSTGIPFSLATFTPNGRKGTNGPMLQAYPDYSWHSSHGTNCNGIVSAFRVAINECNQMWVIDSGVIEDTQLCPPQLLLFDLNSNQLLHRYRFDSSLYTPVASLFITPVIFVRNPRNNCKDTMVYVADVQFPGLVVYDFKNQNAWRVESRWMYADPDYGNHTIAGESFILMDNIFGLSTDKENLYFHPLASVNEFAIPLRILNDRNNFADDPSAHEEQVRKLGSRNSECAAETMDSAGNMYCVTFNPISLISWNVKSMDYSTRSFRVIPADARLLQFVSGMKVKKNKAGFEELWMMSNRFQKMAANTLNPNETNFRVLRRPLNDLYGNLHNTLVFN